MALMLRKAAQPVLMAADLDLYHADLDRDTKEFKLYTPCGKTFAVISGVLFGNLQPTKAEIDYACELLEFWLLRNKLIIDKYIAAFTKLQLYTNLPDKRDDMKIIIPSWNQDNFRVSILHNGIKFVLNMAGELSSLEWDDYIPITKSLKLPASKVGKALIFLTEHVDKKSCQDIVDNILSEMNTCKDM